MTLGGTLNVTFTNGFSPAPNSTFSFLISSNRSGAFATFNYPSNEVGLALSSTVGKIALQVINTRPVISPIANQVATNFSALRLAVEASDPDIPAQALTYALINSPAGAAIDGNGVISWKPIASRTPLSASITVSVTDNGTPSLTTAQTFEVAVLSAGPSPLISRGPGPQENYLLTLTFSRPPGSKWLTQYATNLPGFWFNLETNIAGPNGSWSVVDPNATNFARFYRALPLLVP